MSTRLGQVINTKFSSGTPIWLKKFGDWFWSLSELEQTFGTLAVVYAIVAGVCYAIKAII